MGLIASIVEAAGIPATTISLLREVTEKVNPPRVLYVDRPLGYPLGYPDSPEVQRSVIVQALALLLESRLPVRQDGTLPAAPAVGMHNATG